MGLPAAAPVCLPLQGSPRTKQNLDVLRARHHKAQHTLPSISAQQTFAMSENQTVVLPWYTFIKAKPSLSFNDAIRTILVSYYTVNQD